MSVTHTHHNHRDTVVIVNDPHRGTATHHMVEFDFPLEGAVVFREGNDIGFHLPEGQTILVPDFFKTHVNCGTPCVSFPDFPELGLKHLLQYLDVDPAAGNSWEVAFSRSGLASGGLGEYSDAPNGLIDGIDALDALGTMHSTQTAFTEIAVDSNVDFNGNQASLVGGEADGDGDAGSRPNWGEGESVFYYEENALMADATQEGNLALAQYPGATYELRDGSGAVAGEFGTFTLDAEGNWTYTRTTGIDMMAPGRNYLEDFPVIIRMPDGSTVEWLVTVDIIGENDTPLLTLGPVVTDDASLAGSSPTDPGSVAGDVDVRIIDQGDSIRTFEISGVPKIVFDSGGVTSSRPSDYYGEPRIDANGHWTFAPANDEQRKNLLALKDGEKVEVTLTIKGTDSYGASTDVSVTITIVGTNQGPVFESGMTAESTEDHIMSDLATAATHKGTITATDPEDEGADLTFSTASSIMQGKWGTFSIDENGNWEYTPQRDISFMAEGRSYTESFTVTVSDGVADRTETFTLVFTGDNDIPVVTDLSYTPISDLTTVAADADGVVLAGSVLGKDVDEGDSVARYDLTGTPVARVNGVVENLARYGTLAFDETTGTWRLIANAEQLLALQGVNGSLTIDLTVTAYDESGAASAPKNLTIFVNGDNDLPVFDLTASAFEPETSEDALYADNGILTGTIQATDTEADADPDDVLKLVFSVSGEKQGAYGTLSIDPNTGEWTYSLTKDINFMEPEKPYEERFTIRVSDGKGGMAEHELVITIEGSNDIPMVLDLSYATNETSMIAGPGLSGVMETAEVDANAAITLTVGTATATRNNSNDPTFTLDTYGTFEFDAATGAWSFVAATPAQKEALRTLGSGESLVIIIPVTANDGEGGVDTSGTITITITGTNQDPVITATSFAVGEEALKTDPTFSGKIATTDMDANDIGNQETGTGTLHYSIDGDGEGRYGRFSMRDDGTWFFTRTKDLPPLSPGESLTETFVVVVTDDHGGRTEQTVTLTITGENDPPALQVVDAGTTDLAMNDAPILQGRVTGTDPNADVGDSIVTYTQQGQPAATLDGVSLTLAQLFEYGELRVNSDGTWTFTAADPLQQEKLLGLGEGQRLVVSVQVTGTDAYDLEGPPSTVTITITGTNQAPIFEGMTTDGHASEDMGETSEQTLLEDGRITGTVNARDPDENDTPTYSIKPGTGDGKYGSFAITPDGEWTYIPTGDINRIPEEGVDETVTIVITDGRGGVTEKEITLTITGDNDGPVVKNVSVKGLDTTMRLSGQVTATDPEGDVVSEFTYDTDKALITLPGSSPVLLPLGDYGNFVPGTNGFWTFEAAEPDQIRTLLGLAEGETLTITIPVRATDDTGAEGPDGTITITITGTDQGPVFNDTTLTGATSEDALVLAGGSGISGTVTIAATDSDADTVTYSTDSAQKGLYGTFTVDPNTGEWHYTLNPGQDINFLAHDGKVTEAFTVIATANGVTTEETFTLTITGDNDAPKITGTSHGSTTLDAPDNVILRGTIQAVDVDNGDAITSYAEDTTGTYTFIRKDQDGEADIGGTLSDYGYIEIANDGSWRFVVNDAGRSYLNGLQLGESVLLTIPVTATDDSGTATDTGKGSITLEIKGTNADPVLNAGSLTGHTTEEQVQESGFRGRLTATDNAKETMEYHVVDGQGDYGSLALDPDTGEWTYTPAMNIDFMDPGTSYTETFVVRVSDGRGGVDEKTLTIIIDGSNDAPIVGDIALSSDDATLADGGILRGTVTGTDPDEGSDTIRYSTGEVSAAFSDGTPAIASDYGFFVVDANGTWTFEAQTETQKAMMRGLKPGQTLIITGQAVGTDEHGAQGTGDVVIRIVGGNDAPIVEDASGKSTDTAMGTGFVLEGSITGMDPEDGAEPSTDFTLGKGAATAVIGSRTVPLSEYGDLTINPDGTWELVAASESQQAKMLSLAEGETLTVRVPVHGTDSSGLTGEDATLTITIVGSNQKPEVVASSLEAGTREDTLMAQGALHGVITSSDAEGDTLTYTAGGQQGKYGVLTLDEHGNWTYERTPGLDLNFMADGATYTETFTVTVSDGKGGTVDKTFTLTITGDNDAPVITDVTSGPLDLIGDAGDPVEFGDVVISGTILAEDPDEGDSVTRFTLTPDSPAAALDGETADIDDYGMLEVDPDTGEWTFTPTTQAQLDALKNLPKGSTLTVTAEVEVSDGDATSQKTITITINGVNENPELTPGSLNAATHEDTLLGGPLTGQLAATDANGDASLTYSMAGDNRGQYGSLTLTPDGSWSYVPRGNILFDDGTTHDLNYMGKDRTYTETFEIQVSDGRGGVDQKTLTITITGDNDEPALTAVTDSATDAILAADAPSVILEGIIPRTIIDAGDSLTFEAGAITARRGVTGDTASKYGFFEVDDEGNWTFEAQTTDQKNAVLGLAEGEKLTLTMEVVASDGKGGSATTTVTVTVTGTNQTPVLESVTRSASDEDMAGGMVLGGTITGADIDGEKFTIREGDITATVGGKAVSLAEYGLLTLNDDGTWTLVAQSAAQKAKMLSLDAGENLVITVPVTGTDSHGATGEESSLTITITGTDQPASFPEGNLSAQTHEDTVIAAGTNGIKGVITGSDPDGAITYELLTGEPGKYGTFTLDANGNWTYVLKPGLDINPMAKGEPYTETFTITLADGTEKTFTVTILGDNDVPIITGYTIDDADKDGEGLAMGEKPGEGEAATVISGQVQAEDPDTGDSITHYAISPGSVTATLTDTSVNPPAKRLVNLSDYGKMVLNPDGSWYLETDPDQWEMLNALGGDAILTIRGTVVVTDENGGSASRELSLTLNGSNEAPTFTSDPSDDASAGILEDTLLEDGFRGDLSAFIDPGDDDVLTYTVIDSGKAAHGVLSLDPATGEWTYIPNSRAAIDGLGAGEFIEETFTIRVSDGNGGVAEREITLTITGENDTPVLKNVTVTSTDSALAGGAPITGVITGTDADTGETITFSEGTLIATITNATTGEVTSGLIPGDYGRLTVDDKGNWTFQAQTQEQRDNLLALGPDEILTITLPVIGDDGQELPDSEGNGTITVTVAGTNQGPDVRDATADATDLAMSSGAGLAGSLTGTDPEGDAIIFTNGQPMAYLNGEAVPLSRYGVFTLNPDGSGTWSFEAATQAQKDAMRALGEEDDLVIRVPFTGTDATDNTATDTGTLVITVTGSSQGPDFDAVTLLGETTEDTLIDAGAGGIAGSVSATDPDGDGVTYDASEQEGRYGTFTVNPDGSWTYVLNPDMDIDFMAPGEDYTETFIVSVTDENGDTTEREFVLNIAGDNDAPAINGTTQTNLDTDVPLNDMNNPVLSGVISATDPDENSDPTKNAYLQNGPVTATVDGPDGIRDVDPKDYGRLVLTPDGAWKLIPETQEQLDNLENLADDETLNLTVSVIVTDEHGGSSEKPVTIVVSGDPDNQNAAPVFDPDSLAKPVAEDTLIADGTLEGTLTATDDVGETLTYRLVGDSQGEYGRLTLLPNGRWIYTPTTDINVLQEGKDYAETFRVLVDDGHGGLVERDLVITLEGQNDAPVIGDGDVTLSLTGLQGGTIFEGTVPVTDPDTGGMGDSPDTPDFAPVTPGDGTTITASLNGGSATNGALYGDFTLNADGTWTFIAATPDQQAALLALGDGDTLVITVPVSVTDDAGETVTKDMTITVTGSNQGPVVSGYSDPDDQTEDGLLAKGSLTGRLAATDPDTGDALVYSVKPDTGQGKYGIFTVTEDGRWTYVPKNSLNRLDDAEGDPDYSVTETVTIIVSDGHGGTTEQVIRLTVTGDNDAPVLEESAVTVSDTDLGKGPVAGVITGTDPDDEITFSEKSLTATINGKTIDTPEDYGELHINPDGTWTFIPNDKTSSLKEGETLVITATVTGSDGDAEDDAALTIVIIGEDQPPSITVQVDGDDDTALDQEMHDGGILSGTVSGSDPEAVNSKAPVSYGAITATINGVAVNPDAYGYFTMDLNGNWSFTAYTDEQKANMLALQEKGDLKIIVPVYAGSGEDRAASVIELTVTGIDQDPELTDGGGEALDTEMASGTRIFGTIAGTDPDRTAVTLVFNEEDMTLDVGGGSTATSVAALAATYGTLILNPDGTWSFAAITPEQRANLLALDADDTVTITVPFTGTDETGKDADGRIAITIRGTDNGPVFDAETLQADTTEDALTTGDGTPGVIHGSFDDSAVDVDDPVAYDPEGGDVRYVAETLEGKYGTLTVHEDGTWDYVLDTDINFMASGEDDGEHFTITVEDENGNQTEQRFDLSIAGSNDAPEITGTTLLPPRGDTPQEVILAGVIQGRDVDEGDSVGNYRLDGDPTAVIGGISVDLGDYGRLVLNDDGSWRFVAGTPEQRANLRNLGDTPLVITAAVSAEDSHGERGSGTIEVIVAGGPDPTPPPDNTDPDLSATDLAAGIREDALIAAGKFDGTLPAEDADLNPLTYSLVGADQGRYGTLRLEPDGRWTYTLNPGRNIEFMAQDKEYTEFFVIRVDDGQGGVVEEVITLVITGDNDAPVVAGVTLTPSDMALYNGMEYAGTIPVTDVDRGDSVTLTQGGITAMRGAVGVNATTYGTFILNPDGTWTFAATTPEQKRNLLSLADGEVLEITVNLNARDSSGHTNDTAAGTVTITITGTNQDPVFTGSSLTAATSEDALMTLEDDGSHTYGAVSGQVKATDVDKGDTLTYGLKDAVPDGDTVIREGVYGELALDPDTGAWTYQLTRDISFLEPGETFTEAFIVTVHDDAGGTREETLTVVIGGDAGNTNRPPVLANATATATDMEMYGDGTTGATLSGTFAGTDPNGDAIIYAVGSVNATRNGMPVNLADYGKLTLNPNGTWAFVAETEAQHLNMRSLPEGENLVITVPVIGSDGKEAGEGGASLVITVAGTNQDPVVSGEDPDSIAEDDLLEEGGITGQLDAADPDTGDELTYSVKEGTGTGDYGSFTVDDTGKWTYVPSDTINRLAEGETVTETVTLVVSDEHGGVTEKEITITLTGTNDAPILHDVSVTTSDAALGGGAALTGSIPGFDPEGDAITVTEGTATVSGGLPGLGNLSDYGVLTVNDDGTWSFQARTQEQRDNLLRLGPTQSLIITVPVTGSDGRDESESKNLVITIVGSNQGPIAQVTVEDPVGIACSEDAMMREGFAMHGRIAVTDPENDAVTTCTIRDSSGETVAVDPTSPTVIEGLYGTLTLQANGEWTYTRNTGMDLNAMTAGQEYTDTFTIYAEDANGNTTEKELSFIISGDNDSPFITGTTQGELQVDSLLGGYADLTGQVLGFDPDSGDTVRNYRIVAGSSLVLEISGQRVDLSQLGGLLDGLLDGADPLLNVVGTLLDGVLDILGGLLEGTGVTNLLFLDEETGSFTLSGDLLGVLLGAVESLTDGLRDLLDDLARLDSNLVDNLLEALPWLALDEAEDLIALKVLVEAEDTHGASTGEREIGITLVGGDTRPGLGGPVNEAVTEDRMLADHFITGSLAGSDPEGDALTYSLSEDAANEHAGHGKYGTLTVNPDGTWTYTLMNGEDCNALAEGQTAMETFTVLVMDEHGGSAEQQITIAITGENDAPIFAVETLATTLVENEIPESGIVTGRLAATDADTGASLTYAGGGAGKYGTFSVDAQGNWTYTPDDKLWALSLGEVGSERFTVTVSDGKGGTEQKDFVITVVGTGNVPQITGNEAAIDEDALMGDLIQSGSLAPENAGDSYSYMLEDGVATGDANTSEMTGLYGTLTLNSATGEWEYTRNPDVDLNFMSEGGEYKDDFRVLVDDGAGNQKEEIISLTIIGKNDAPVLNGTVQNNTLDTDTNEVLALTGRFQASDVDEGDRLTFTESGISNLVLNGIVLDEDGITTLVRTTLDSLLGDLYDANINVLFVIQFPLGSTLETIVNDIVVNTVGGILDTFLTPITDLVATGVVDINAVTGEWSIAADQLETLLGLVDDLVSALSDGLLDAVAGILDNPLLSTLVAVLDLPGVRDLPVVGELLEVVAGLPGAISDLPLLNYDREAGEGTLGLNVPVTVEDGHGGADSEEIVIDLLGGVNNVPEFIDTADSFSRQVGEGALLVDHTVTGQIQATDGDNPIDAPGAGLSYVVTTGPGDWGGNGQYGNLTLNETTGEWTYTLTHDIGSLAAGEECEEVFTVIVRDGNGGQTEKEISITITGENDAPVFDISTLNKVVAETQLMEFGRYAGRIVATDEDHGARLTYSIDGVSADADGSFSYTVAGQGVFRLSPDGAWTFTPINPNMDVSAMPQVTIPGIVVTDEHNTFSRKDFILSMVEANQAPDIGVTAELTDIPIHEDSMMEEGFVLRGNLNAVDPEGDPDIGVILPGVTPEPDGSMIVEGQYGILTLHPNGEWTYKRIPGLDLNFMAEGQHYTDSFTVQTEDSSGARANKQITFSIVGDNEAPVITGIDQGGLVAEVIDGVLQFTEDGKGGIVAYDQDEGDRVQAFNFTEGSTLILDIAGKEIDLNNLGGLLDGLLDSADPVLHLVGEAVNGVLSGVLDTVDDLAGDLLLLNKDDGTWTLAAGPLNTLLDLLDSISDAVLNVPLVGGVLDTVLVSLPWLGFSRDSDLVSLKFAVEAEDSFGASTGSTEITIPILGGNATPEFSAATFNEGGLSVTGLLEDRIVSATNDQSATNDPATEKFMAALGLVDGGDVGTIPPIPESGVAPMDTSATFGAVCTTVPEQDADLLVMQIILQTG